MAGKAAPAQDRPGAGAAARSRLRRRMGRVNCWRRLGPLKVRRVDALAEAPAADRHHVPRRASIAAGDARAHVRHAARSPSSSRTGCTTCSAWRCGAARRSTWPCVSCTRIPGCGCDNCARRFRISVFRCCCAHRTQWAIRRIRTTWCEEFICEAAAQGIDIFRIFDSLNWLPNMKVAMEAVRKTEQDVRGGDLLHGRHSRSAARQVPARLLRANGARSWSGWARTYWPSRTWRGCASLMRPRSW